MTDQQPYREPLRTTAARGAGIAVVAATIIAPSAGGWSYWPALFAAMLWPAFGGHWVELWYLNWLRPRIGGGRGRQVGARVAVWFLGGLVLGAGAWATLAALTRHQWSRSSMWWLTAGVAFIGIELTAHLALQLRGRPSFYNGRG